MVAVLSGGNIDPLLMMRVIRHGMHAAGRYLQFRVRVPDKPGSLAGLMAVLPRRTPTCSRWRTCAPASARVDEVEIAVQLETKGSAALRRGDRAPARAGLPPRFH